MLRTKTSSFTCKCVSLALNRFFWLDSCRRFEFRSEYSLVFVDIVGERRSRTPTHVHYPFRWHQVSFIILRHMDKLPMLTKNYEELWKLPEVSFPESYRKIRRVTENYRFIAESYCVVRKTMGLFWRKFNYFFSKASWQKFSELTKNYFLFWKVTNSFCWQMLKVWKVYMNLYAFMWALFMYVYLNMVSCSCTTTWRCLCVCS